MQKARAIFENPKLGWRWTYHINTIIVAVAVVLLFIFYHPPTFDLLHERKTKRQILKQLDCKLEEYPAQTWCRR